MNVPQTAELQEGLEKFRHLLFHLQMQCGSIHDIFRFFKQENSMEHFEALKALDPQLMPQLLAREYVLEAKQAESPESAKQHLETALSLDPNCPEACFEFALLSESPEGAMKWYQRSMDATVKLLGRNHFETLLAEFQQAPWEQVEIHTYLKAKASLAEKLFRSGHYDIAALHFQELLNLNPSDELELHQFLMVALLCQGSLKEAQALKRSFPNDWSAQWYYCRAFLQYKLEGDTRKSRRLLQRAFRRNLWVAIYLLGLSAIPVKKKYAVSKLEEKAPFKEGSRTEAGECVRCIAPAFVEDSKLVWWVWDALSEM